MSDSGKTTMVSRAAQTEAVLPSAKEEGKRGKFGRLAAVFSQLLGKAAQDDHTKNRATMPTVESLHGADDKSRGDGAAAGLAAAGKQDASLATAVASDKTRPNTLSHTIHATEQPSLHARQAASDKVLTSAKSDNAEPATPKAPGAHSRSAEGPKTSAQEGTAGASATVTTTATETATAFAAMGDGGREGHDAETQANAKSSPAPHGQELPVSLAKGTSTLSWVAAARYAQTADETQPLQAPVPTSPQQKLSAGGRPRAEGAGPGRAAQDRQDRPVTGAPPETKAGDKQAVTPELAKVASNGTKTAESSAKTTAFPPAPAAPATQQASGQPTQAAKAPAADSSVPWAETSPQLGQGQPAAPAPQGSDLASKLPRHESIERSNGGRQTGSQSQVRPTVTMPGLARGSSSEEKRAIEHAGHRSTAVATPSNARPSTEDKPDITRNARPAQAQPLNAELPASDGKGSGKESNEQPRPASPRSSALPFLAHSVADTRTPVSNTATLATAGSPASAAPVPFATARLPIQAQQRETKSTAPSAGESPSDKNAAARPHASASSTTSATQQTTARHTVSSRSDAAAPERQPSIPQRAASPSPTAAATQQTGAPQHQVDSSSEKPAQRSTSPQAAPSAPPAVHVASPKQETPSPALRGAKSQTDTQRSPGTVNRTLGTSGPDLTAAKAQTTTAQPATPRQPAPETTVAPSAEPASPKAAASPEATTPQRTSGRPRAKSEARPASPAPASAQADAPDGAKPEAIAHGADKSHRPTASSPQANNQARPSSPASAPAASSPAQTATDTAPTSPVGSARHPVGQEDLETPTVRARTKRTAMGGGLEVAPTSAQDASNKDSAPTANSQQQAQASAPAKGATQLHAHQHAQPEPATVSSRSASSESSPTQTAAHAAPSATEQAAQAAPVPFPAAPPPPFPTTSTVVPTPTAFPSTVESPQVNPVSVEAASIYQHAAEDSGLAVTVLPHVAHLSLNSDDGNLSLHVRVRDGNADVNVGGSMAPIFESKAPEMRTVLAHQGLGLGSFAADHQGQGQHSQQRPEAAGSEVHHAHPAPSTRTRATVVESATTDEGRIHITA